MKMTYDFAARLMNDFFLLACYANGRLPETDEEISTTEQYARDMFLGLTEDWEEVMGEEWEIEEPNSEEEEWCCCDNPNCPDCIGTLDDEPEDECPWDEADCEECNDPECPLNFQYVKTGETDIEELKEAFDRLVRAFSKGV